MPFAGLVVIALEEVCLRTERAGGGFGEGMPVLQWNY
jgi:hypothetical protein